MTSEQFILWLNLATL